MYVDVPFKNLALTNSNTSAQFDHENELRILHKRLEQVRFTFPCIRCLSEILHSSIIVRTQVRIVEKHLQEQVIPVEQHYEMDLA
jgi:hypothetical protein